jgi:hypothetical protein
MHLEILTETQIKQLELLKMFKREFTLVGGTAIALQIGHRKSIDFDLFKMGTINKQKIKAKFHLNKIPFKLLFENSDGLHLMVEDVKWTFFYYPFPIYQELVSSTNFKSPDLLTLSAMKAYALARRAKWKDYVDLHQLIKNHYSISQISKKAKALFGDAFSEKLFRMQLTFFKDIDYSEPIDWLISPIEDQIIQKELISFATELS